MDSLIVQLTVGGVTKNLWETSGSKGDKWNIAQVFIGAKQSAVLAIQARRGSNFNAALAVDDLTFIDCQPPIATSSCLSTKFSCSNKYCIDPQLECNFADDCGDASDEVVCTIDSGSVNA